MNATEFHRAACEWRGVDPDHACKHCGGAGTRIYSSTSTWHGGAGGQMITAGVCDRCWGSGDENAHWPSHRTFESMQRCLAATGGK